MILSFETSRENCSLRLGVAVRVWSWTQVLWCVTQVCLHVLQVSMYMIGQAALWDEGQSTLGMQVPNKVLDWTDLTKEDVGRWVNRPVTLTCNETRLHKPDDKICAQTHPKLQASYVNTLWNMLAQAKLHCSIYLMFHVQIKPSVSTQTSFTGGPEWGIIFYHHK